MKPSSTYAFARNPTAAIKTAFLRTVEERSDNPRVVWRALLKSCDKSTGDSLSIEELTHALKHFGTGIQLTAEDVAILFDFDATSASITFEMFANLIHNNH